MRKAFSVLFILVLGLSMRGAAETIDFDFGASTPPGSWQEREIKTTDSRGKENLSVMRVSYLGDEERGGEDYVWTEIEMTNFKVKGSKRKQQGSPVIMKVLTKKSSYQKDIINALSNFNDMATEVIMQVGNSQPMRIKGAGAAMGPMAQSVGLQVDYHINADGAESVTVPAGTFECARYRGEGQASLKIAFKSVEVHSRTTQWVSEDVPFGLVKVVSDDVVNGKPQQVELVLTAFGRSGATSKITGEPQDMPNVGGLFGGN